MFYKEEKLARRLNKPINDPIGFNISFSRRKKIIYDLEMKQYQTNHLLNYFFENLLDCLPIS